MMRRERERERVRGGVPAAATEKGRGVGRAPGERGRAAQLRAVLGVWSCFEHPHRTSRSWSWVVQSFEIWW